MVSREIHTFVSDGAAFAGPRPMDPGEARFGATEVWYCRCGCSERICRGTNLEVRDWIGGSGGIVEFAFDRDGTSQWGFWGEAVRCGI